MKRMYKNPETEIAAIDAERLMGNLSVSDGSSWSDPSNPPVPHAPTNRNTVIGK